MTRAILIRHGVTDWNLESRWQGQSDTPLSASGLRQAEEVAAQLSGRSIQAIYSSDLQRANQTANVIATIFHLPVRRDPRLREANLGVWEGMVITDIKARYREKLEQRFAHPELFAPPGGETIYQVLERMVSAFEEIQGRHPHETVVVVAHGFCLAVVIAHYENRPLQEIWGLMPAHCTARELDLSPHPRPAVG